MTTQPEPQPEPAELVLPTYELTASRRGYIVVYGKLEEHEGRLANLPTIPDNMASLATTGTYATVAAAATRLNEAQIRSGYLDYLYAPEPRKLATA